MEKNINLSDFDEANQEKIKRAWENNQQIIVEYEYDDYDYEEYFASNWISDFFESENIDWMVNIDKEYLNNDSNFDDIKDQIPNFQVALSVLRNEDIGDVIFDENMDKITQMLYFLIHQKYIQTEKGMKQIFDLYEDGYFGECPRIACKGQKTLPFGISTKFGESPCMLYCPRCKDIYYSKNPRMYYFDGCAFGPYFALRFLKEYENRLHIPCFKNVKLSVRGFKLSEKKRRLNRESYFL